MELPILEICKKYAAKFVVFCSTYQRWRVSLTTVPFVCLQFKHGPLPTEVPLLRNLWSLARTQ